MPDWVTSSVDIIQLILNVAAVVGGAAVWGLYVKKLQATIALKDTSIESVEKNRDHWRDKARDLEKRSPEYVEHILADRIQIREDEISRLTADKALDAKALRTAESEKASLEQDLYRAQGFRAMLALEGDADVSESASSEDEPGQEQEESLPIITVERIGEVAVDSGQLIVADPCYIDSEWAYEPFLPEVQMSSSGAGATRNFSYDGACRSTLSGDGHGELAFKLGHKGAGVAFATAWGDGMYSVYAEKHDDRIVRVYVNVG